MPLGDAQIFVASSAKVDQVKVLLDSSAVQEKLVGLKRLIAMISKGKEVSSLFTDVIKNIICPSLEVKKLVYIYMLHYAELKPDEALLSINTFQKDLGDKNQFIRALALRVMSSIRNKLITQIVTLAIKKCATDASPYVRKAAAIAIPKVFSLDIDSRESLIEIICMLLRDNSTVVLGAAIFAFSEVCPDRFDLLHPHFRKLCHLCVDCDEWGQVLVINTLVRYARTQFLDPVAEEAARIKARDEKIAAKKEAKKNSDKSPKSKKKSKKSKKKKRVSSKFYSDDEDSSSSSEHEDDDDDSGVSDEELEPVELDPDHRLFIRCILPLLQSRNSSVVMAVASALFYLATSDDFVKAARPLVRILRSHRETQYFVLLNIVTYLSRKPEVFAPFIKDFFVNATDPSFIRLLKVEVMTHLASTSTVAAILRELKGYVKHSDRKFVAATIQAFGRVADRVPEVAESVIHGLVGLISSKNEFLISESVVVMRQLLQKNPAAHAKFIVQLTKLLDSIKVPVARTNVIWMMGEYYDRVKHLAPDALRVLAKNFVNEEEVVKLQIVNLAGKAFAREPSKVALLFQYVMNLAKYDQSYDIRDRARLLRHLLVDADELAGVVAENAADILLATKEAPVFRSNYQDRSRFCLATTSHAVDHTATGYTALPDFPEEQPDPAVREVKEQRPEDAYEAAKGDALGGSAKKKDKKKSKKSVSSSNKKPANDLDAFYDDESSEESESSSEEDETSEEEDDDSEAASTSEEESSEEEDSDEDSSDEEDDSEEEEDSDDESSEEESSEEESSEEESSSSEEEVVVRKKKPSAVATASSSSAKKTAPVPVPAASKKGGKKSKLDDLDSLLDFSDMSLGVSPSSSSSAAGPIPLTPSSGDPLKDLFMKART